MLLSQILASCRSKPRKNYKKNLILTTLNFQSKLETFTELKKKKNFIGISVFGFENKVKYSIYV